VRAQVIEFAGFWPLEGYFLANSILRIPSTVYTDKPGQPPLPTRLMAGLAILKHTYDLSDDALCDRWVENPYFQYFCGEEFFQHALVFGYSTARR
jgi:hypothetical protein